ncbi:YhgE/Pip domain-containing protein [Amycolatopsis acidiphila]|uniref:YhgE/Pip domain-containing protein n=1 Tax=Amycolatopsis acidiphila TaxID=715473 RepID=A0A558AKN3_9PSEU|nr:YhgE/Pip domain-containing protein [Amycolatopsis acidiphila]TVT24816.1 YhgE/Pip domain-containing protein [Amycolatopsis acidiphila]UIJ62797.1 YhgE/Pip domain-containing protein [Amycolatopsis acidiphila]GHG64254.1 ABC transporter [Amycolatopsis acidiphila]
MTSFRIALNELRRLTAGTLPKLAMAALVLVPLLYASFYLYANYDPYGRLSKLPAAIVNEDAGTQERDVGREVTGDVVGSGTFGWHEVSAAEAQQGVREDKYSFAITIPKDFSAALLSSGNFTPQQATIRLTTNDADNYLSHTIANQVAEQIRSTIAEKVGAEAANRFLIGFSTIYGKTQEAADGATQLADGAGRLLGGQQQLADGASQLTTGSTQLSAGLDTLRSSTAALPGQTRQLADGAAQVSSGNAQVAAAGALLASGSADLRSNLDSVDGQVAQRLRATGLPEAQVQQVLTVLRDLRAPVDQANTKIQTASSQLDQLADGSRRVAAGAAALAASAPQLTGGISQAADGASALSTGAAKLNDGENTALEGTRQLSTAVGQLRDGLNEGLKQIPNPDDPTRTATADTIADPVTVDSAGVANAGTYGAGLAPFFVSLATWIGAFVLFLLLRPLSARALAAGVSPLRVAVGGWLASAVLGVAQVLVLFGAVTWLVGIHVAHPLGAIGFAILASLTFTAIVHALNAMFGAVGKFLGLVLLVLQLVSAGGTFPWQTLPDALYPLHLVLPMGYVVDGLRHLLYTGASLQSLLDIGVLCGWLAAAIAVSVLAARRQRVWTVSKLRPELSL